MFIVHVKVFNSELIFNGAINYFLLMHTPESEFESIVFLKNRKNKYLDNLASDDFRW